MKISLFINYLNWLFNTFHLNLIYTNLINLLNFNYLFILLFIFLKLADFALFTFN